MKIYWSGEYSQHWIDKFSAFGEITTPCTPDDVRVPRILEEDPLVEALKDTELYICGYDRVTGNVLRRLPNLKMILSVRDGPEENVDLKTAEELGIPVVSSNGRCTVSVAELSFILMCNLARPIVTITNKMRAEGWNMDRWNSFRAISKEGSELWEKTMGVVGLGRNGRHLAMMGKGVGMNVIAYDPFVTAEQMAELGIEKVELDELMKRADYVHLQARLNDSTKGMITRELIYMMKPTACLINCARGKLMDNGALFDALNENVIRAAALDVFEIEPSPHHPEITDLDERVYKIDPQKLLITSHMAGITQERVHHQCENIYKQFLAYRKGEVPAGLQTRKVFESEGFAEHGGVYWKIDL